MAVGPRPSEPIPRYDPTNDFTSDQLHRFGKVANRAQRAREEKLKEEEFERLNFVERAKRKAMKPVVKRDNKNAKSVRYAIWMIVAMALLLWLMYMTG